MVSRVAKNPIDVPQGVDVKIQAQLVSVKGKNGELTLDLHPSVALAQEENQLKISPKNDSSEANALAGTMRALLANNVHGVSEGFEKRLELRGVGYRAKAQGKKLNLNVGYSHPVDVDMPEGVTVETPSNTEVVLKGADKQQVSQVAANIRAIRAPEPYKGKGIRYMGEHVSLKEGKKK